MRVFLLLLSRLIEAKDVVFECGPKCGCGPACVNRTSQRGLKYRLEVYIALPQMPLFLLDCPSGVLYYLLSTVDVGRFFVLQTKDGLSGRGILFLLGLRFVST